MKKLLLLSLLTLSSAHAYFIDLTAAELEKLKKGEQIERIEEIKDEPFPKVTIVSVIEKSPKENMKIFTDFENHKNFIPGLVRSKIVRHEGNETDVDFEMHMPLPVSNSEYVTRHTVVEEGKNQKLTWKLLRSEQIKDSQGVVMFEEFEGKSLFTYVNHISPKSRFAWTVKSKVAPDIRKNVKVIIKHLAK